MRLKDRVCVITAAGSGMGRASVELFAAEGAHVYAADRDLAAVEQVAKSARERGHRVTAVRADATSRDDWTALFQQVEQDHGVLHVLYNHVGSAGVVGFDVSDSDFARVVELNCHTAFIGTQLALPLLRKAQGKGSLIFTASTTGLVGTVNSPVYSMAKGGVVLLARSVALRLASEGIRSNAVCPGPIDTPMLPLFYGLQPNEDGSMSAELSAKVQAAVPMGRAGKPEEVAQAALFLASDEASYVTGIALPVDGGYTAR